jgi:2-keto-4-pentenoate hydratase/2-oxohepta-3-ene-1,7-dioic acid hydratase in catechol pathway
MADRYVRIKTGQGKIHYGLLELNQSVKLLSGPPWLGGKPNGELIAPDTYRLLAPCKPSKIVCVGRNYAEHAHELGNELPREPLLFLKPLSAILAPEGTIMLPPQSQQVDYEGEMALVIGSYCSNYSPKQALGAMWGYTIANDVTARDLQRQDSQWTRAKGFDTFCPLGPWIVRDINPSARLQTLIRGKAEPVQSATIDQMVFSPEALISYISQIMTLVPGDIILTGTPAGVGPLKDGDRVSVEIEGIGKLQNNVAMRPPMPPEPDDDNDDSV